MRKLFLLFALFAVVSSNAQSSQFVRGADISWCSEMEADGMKFYNLEGEETEIFSLMKQIGMNATERRFNQQGLEVDDTAKGIIIIQKGNQAIKLLKR